MKLRIGTRASPLALKQTDLVAMVLGGKGIKYEIVPIKTTGDRIQDRNLYEIGGKALFLKELEEAMLRDEIDIAIHSMKDVPAFFHEDLAISPILEREDARDILVSQYGSIQDLPQGALIGTSSMRRKVQLANIRPDLKFATFRGNVGTRLKKLDDGVVDATILAHAGLSRLDIWQDNFSKLDEENFIPAVGQGVLALQYKKARQDIAELALGLCDEKLRLEVEAERAFLEEIDGDCDTPLGAYAKLQGDEMHVILMLGNPQNYKMETRQIIVPAEQAVAQVKEIARELREDIL